MRTSKRSMRGRGEGSSYEGSYCDRRVRKCAGPGITSFSTQVTFLFSTQVEMTQTKLLRHVWLSSLTRPPHVQKKKFRKKENSEDASVAKELFERFQ